MNDEYSKRCEEAGYPAVGAYVLIAKPFSDTEIAEKRHYPGEVYRVLRYAKPHGFAVIGYVDDNGGPLWVHPESLAVVTHHPTREPEFDGEADRNTHTEDS